ncbi:hypothetical protein H310_06433 [Aphanomyces invadans]|uniref:HSF-type DNA-binding domain-containing protein n=1 Tax=Aphanomyces invadans TaxID=157072 RepID=A0A024U654_9STRA|nr:hypothetical protein H310_06433 [Aphanomyces invadans]ETW01871.1 hypothetical protein H310_06433 [Aphanomyces invadans]|eukprot:XP_008869719.1 hypothetical protein H310_06433 [Aphanomyces invadans]
MASTGQGNLTDITSATNSEDLTEGSFASNSGWWSNDSDDGHRERQSDVSVGTTKLASENTASYLDKLHRMLESSPSTVVAWTRHGSAFAVYNRDELETTILPQYFSSGTFESFIRLLSAHGFRKAKHTINGTPTWEFRHPNFTNGRQLYTIVRRRRRRRRDGAPEPPPRTGRGPMYGHLKSTLIDMMAVVRNLKTELVDTKALVMAYARMHQGNVE